MKPITIDDIVKHGFEEYPVDNDLHPHVTRNWEKWYRRDGHKTFCIHIRQYTRAFGNYFAYQASSQLYYKPHETPMTFNIEILNGFNLSDAINLIGAIYNMTEGEE